MKIENQIPKIIREELRELRALRKTLIDKGVVTDAEIKAKKEVRFFDLLELIYLFLLYYLFL
jgi:transcription initiation factor IIE alpha subunit